MTTTPTVGVQLRTRREETGLSQAEVGQLAGVHRGTIRNVEMGKPSEDRTLRNVARVLGCTHDDGTIRPVLSTTATRVLARAALALDGEAAAHGTAWYLGAVQTLATGGRPQPGPTADMLIGQMTVHDANLARLELFGEYPIHPAPGPQHTPPVQTALPELHAVLNSGLPANQQADLVDHLRRRRAIMETALLDEARTLIVLLTRRAEEG